MASVRRPPSIHIEKLPWLISSAVNYLSSIVKNFDVRFGTTIASFHQHKELLEDEVWAAYLARVLGQKPGQYIFLVPLSSD